MLVIAHNTLSITIKRICSNILYTYYDIYAGAIMHYAAAKSQRGSVISDLLKDTGPASPANGD